MNTCTCFFNKIRLIPVFVLLMHLFTVDLKAQVIIGPGWVGTHAISNAVPSDAVPYNYNDKSVHIQLVYTANDLTTGGATGAFTIDSLGWYIMEQIGGALSNYTLKMKNTTANNTQVYDPVGLTVVRNAADLTPAADTAWYMIALDNPFQWDGSSNLLIDVCWGINPSSGASGKIRHISLGSSFERILLKSNFSNTCSLTPTQTAAFKPYLRLTASQPTGLEEQKIANLLIVPNPGHGMFTIQGLNAEVIEVINTLGEPILIQKNNSTSIDLSNQAPGIYFVKAITPQGLIKGVSRLIIE